VDNLPVTGGSVQPVVLEGHPELLPRDQPTVEVRKVTPGYFRTMSIPVLRGRDAADTDVEVMLVSRSAAKLLWGDDDPVGRRVTLPLQSKTTVKQVIGVVGDVKQGQLSEPAAPTVYEFTREHEWPSLAFVLRTSVPPLSLAPAAAAAIHEIDPMQPIEDVRSMQAVVDETLVSQRFSTLLLGGFAAVALTLAAVGIYSVLSYVVRGRSREIGIRSALGARTSDVVRLVVAEGMTPALIGIAAGGIGALVSARILARLVFGVSASDPLTFLIVAGTLALVALLATLIPAYRASRVDPLTVLR
jgi:putative ABC transport system permease protein